uniref:Adhesion G protein-coupled receptor F3b n=1 Tax=Neolamprologus brichardi TaxID=32507 RepID=A0A3Q4MFS7_NEOBR
MTEITYAGLSASVVSLVISLLIELIVWSKVVKTNTLHLRHTAHVNISLCLLVADCCFLASSKPESISEIWCRIAALLKHFCYLAMFFWMLSLSTMLLHQAVFLFHKVGKKTYLRFSLILGYVCPFLIVFITFLTNNAGAQDAYFSLETCWSLGKLWNIPNPESNKTLAEKYLKSVENLIAISNISNDSNLTNLNVQTCSEDECTNTVFNAEVTVKSSGNGIVKTAGFKYLQDYLPNTTETFNINSIVVSTTTQRGKENLEITLKFPLLTQWPRHVELQCVSWNYNQSKWTAEGCKWGGASNPDECTCNHLTSFAILMSRYPIKIPYMTEITYAGLSASVMSLVISLLIELVVWSKVVKTNTLHLRHTAHVNISLCLLVADCCFLASSKPESISEIWCRIAALLKHFCYLAMFFWMLSLSTMLLHQAVFLFHKVGKKTYLRFSLILGYVCPFLIVFITFLTNNAGAQDAYFSLETCWLVYSGILKGTIYTFILPVGIIVFINLFAMIVVIMKLLDHKSTEKSHEKEIQAAKTVLRSVILLTPIFGLPWIFGFATFSLDLTAGAVTLAVNYAFVVLNAFQVCWKQQLKRPKQHMYTCILTKHYI